MRDIVKNSEKSEIFLKKGIDITENRSKIFSRCRVYPLSLHCLVQRRERDRAKVSPTLYIGLYICSFIKNRRLRLRVSAGRDYFRSGYDLINGPPGRVSRRA